MTETTRIYDDERAPQYAPLGSVPNWSPAAILEALGPVVYAIRTKDQLIKIGFTGNLAARRRHLSTRREDMLGFFRGTLEDEQAIHAQLVPFRARGREYYHPTPEVLAVVNDMRADIGLSPIAA